MSTVKIPMRRSRPVGAATVEFALAFALVLWPLLAAVFELSQISLARHALSFAVYETARAESREAGSDFDMRRRLAAGLLPLLGGVVLSERTSLTIMATAMTRSMGETLRPDLLQYSLESVGPVGGQGVVRRLRVTYCRELFFAPVKQFVPRILKWSENDPFDLACLLRERLPLKASAAVYALPPSRASEDPRRPNPPGVDQRSGRRVGQERDRRERQPVGLSNL